MNKEFVTYEQALALKELALKKLGVEDIGHTFGFYASFYTTATPTLETEWHDEYDAFEIIISAPLKQQVFRWFREKYDLSGIIDLHVSAPSHWYVRIDVIEINDFIYHSEDEHKYFTTYEEAENACIDKLIEIAKQQDNGN